METESKPRLADVFVSITDLRQAGKVEHDLVELLAVAVNGVLVGADTFIETELWAQEKLELLRRRLPLERGIPAHDPSGRLFGLIDPAEFEAAFRRWVGSILPALGPDAVVAIDGKTSRRSGKVDATGQRLCGGRRPGAGTTNDERRRRSRARRPPIRVSNARAASRHDASSLPPPTPIAPNCSGWLMFMRLPGEMA